MVTLNYNAQRNYYGAIDAAILSARGVKLDSEQLAAMGSHRIANDWKKLDIQLPPAQFRNALSSENITRGAGIVPEGFLAGWIRGESALNVVQKFATVHDLPRGGSWRLPLVNDGAAEGELLQEGESGTQSDVAFGQNIFRLKRFQARPLIVPNSLNEDGENFPAQIGLVLGDQIARIKNRKFTLGTGVSGPLGIVPGATAVAAASATTISSDDLLSLLGAVGSGFLDPAGSAFMCSQAIFVYLLKLKDGGGTPIFRDGRVFGFRVIVNQHMSSTIASGEKTVVFGRLDRYHVADGPVALKQAEEPYLELNSSLFIAWQFADGNIANPSDTPFVALTH